MQNRSVLISGIGIAGQTLAYWLSVRGFRPTLVEQASQLRSGGYAIDFWGVGYDVAERMGLVSKLKDRDYHVEEVRFVDASGRRVGGFSVELIRRLTGGRYVSISRSDLAKLIYDRIAGRCEMLFGDRIVAIEQRGDGVHVAFERTAPRRFDLLVGADGLHSVVRGLIFGGEGPFENDLGYMVAAFEIEGYRPRDDRVYVSYTVPGRQAARLATAADRTLFLFVFVAADPTAGALGDIRAQKTMLRAAFAGAGWECPRVLAALEDCDDLYFDRVSQIRMPSWSRGRVALVGDAAFCPSLLAGEGAALAMTSGYVLAGELAAADGQATTAYERYERVLRPFMARKQEGAVRLAGAFIPKTRIGLLLRNFVTTAFAVPFVGELVLGRSLIDKIDLPVYPPPSGD